MCASAASRPGGACSAVSGSQRRTGSVAGTTARVTRRVGQAARNAEISDTEAVSTTARAHWAISSQSVMQYPPSYAGRGAGARLLGRGHSLTTCAPVEPDSSFSRYSWKLPQIAGWIKASCGATGGGDNVLYVACSA